MKLHEKILSHYLSCTSPVDKEGYLFKRVWEKTKHTQNKIPESFHTIANVVILLYSDIFLCRKSGMLPTSGGGLSWKRTCFSTRSAQVTDTCWASLCWKDVQWDASSLMDSLHSPWHLKGLDSKPTDLQPWIVRLKRAGWKLWSQPATVICPCWWETWGDSMKVCCLLMPISKFVGSELHLFLPYVFLLFIFFLD